ncbi:GAG-pre-integrase domain [Arabidopsis suecica]|uniref:GAG-pre-integrase domain n=1 Tax=Arabidopsis suecica TaxID=45249 RepID=A0A8T2CPS5_ARASU|nr:GAG-pre-integrase domain [Arabidopsis suecica]
MTNPSSTPNEKPFSISQIKAYVPITLDMNKLNYQAWRELLETHCTCFGVLGHLDGTSVSTAETEKTWKEHDGLVKMWIYGTISESILDTVLKTKCSARDLWLTIENMFRDNKEARALELENELRTTVIGDLSVHTYCQKLKTLSDQLSNLDSPVTNRNLVMHLLNGLSDKFDNITNVIKHKSPFPTFIEARSMLTMEEKRLTKHTPSALVNTNTASAPELLYTSSDQQRQSNSSGYSNNNHGGQSSYNNGGRGNRGRGRGGRHNRGRGRYNNWSPSYGQHWPFGNQPWPPAYPPSLSPYPNPQFPQMGSFPNYSAQNNFQPGLLGPAPSRPNTEALLAHAVAQQQLNPYLPAAITHAFNTMQLPDPNQYPWILDSGATNHIATNSGTLHSIFNSSNLPSITVGNGSCAPVTKMGQGILNSSSRPFYLRNVLVCPSIIKNLISVRKFVTDNFCTLEFDPFGFTAKDLQTRAKLLRCDSPGPLYTFTPSSSNHSSLALAASHSNSSLWHRRLGHPNDQVLHRILSSLSISCNKTDLTTLCQACQLGKHTRLPFFTSTSIVSHPFEIIHSDIWTSPVLSTSGIKYYLIFLDQFSHYVWVYPLHRKSDTFAKYLHFSNYVQTQFHCKIKALQCDNGGEYDNRAFKEQLASDDTVFRFSCPYTSQQNGHAERMLRTINNVARTFLLQASMPLTYWVEALNAAVHTINLLPSSAINNEVPHTKLFKTPPSYHHLKTFGCLCYPNVLPSTPHKLAPRSVPCAFLGYPTDHRGFRCLDMSTKKIILSRHVTFDEASFPFSTSQPPSVSSISPPILLPPSPIPHDSSPPQNLTPPSPPPAQIPPPPPIPTHSMTTRSKSGIVKPRIRLCLHTDATISPLPVSHVQAAKDPNWTPAMKDEYDALIKRGTWRLVPRPVATNIIRSMWLFRHKFKADGTLSRYKARLVANGKSQQPGIDCEETFSPVVKPATIRTVLSVATSRDWPLHQLDVKNAFLHGDLEETVYMHQPPGFVDASKPDHVCLLQRSLYGLKQAPRAWYNRFATYAKTIGFKQSSSDASLFILCHGSDIAYLLLYVDDIVLTATTPSLLQRVISHLSSEFEMTDLGQLHHFLGISVQRDAHGLFLHQQNYVADILHRANMTNCNPCITPADTRSKLAANDSPSVSDPTLYRSLAGALQYLTFTRPDIAFSVQQICLFMHDPRESHLLALKRILRYLKGTIKHGLHIYRSTSSGLIAYSDADWAGCPSTRRSTSGYCVFLGDNLVSWSSKRQATISRSSAEAEYRGVANAVSETTWLRTLLLEMKIPLPRATIVYCDNISAIYLSSNPVQHQRTKHVEIDIHFVREKVAIGHVRVLHVPSAQQFADVFTKGLPSSLFLDFRTSLSVRPPSTAHLPLRLRGSVR